jgi:hypothetical protein
MATQKFMGRGQLIERLTEQMRTQINPPSDPRGAVIAVLIKRGFLKPDGKTFTFKGAARNRMTAEERAIDRTATRLKKSTGQFVYDPATNTTKLKSRR